MKIPINKTLLTAAMSAVAAIGVIAAVLYVNLNTPQQVEASSPSPQFQSTCKLTTPLLINDTKTKADHHKTTGRDDLHEMFMRSHLTFKGQDDYTVADIKARPDKQGANWQGEGPSLLWQHIYKQLDRMETCRETETARHDLKIAEGCIGPAAYPMCISWERRNNNWDGSYLAYYTGAAVNATPWNLESLRAQPGVPATATWDDYRQTEAHWKRADFKGQLSFPGECKDYLVTVEAMDWATKTKQGKGTHLRFTTYCPPPPAEIATLTADQCDDKDSTVCLNWTTSSDNVVGNITILGWSAREAGTKTTAGVVPLDESKYQEHDAITITDKSKRFHKITGLDSDRWHRFVVTIVDNEVGQEGKAAVYKTPKPLNQSARVTRLEAVACENPNTEICLEWDIDGRSLEDDFVIQFASAKEANYNGFRTESPVYDLSKVDPRPWVRITDRDTRSYTFTGLTPNRKHWVAVDTLRHMLDDSPVLILQTHSDPQVAPIPDCAAEIYKNHGETTPYLATYCNMPSNLQGYRTLSGHHIRVESLDGWEIYQGKTIHLNHELPMPHARLGQDYRVMITAIYDSTTEGREYSVPAVQRMGYASGTPACRVCASGATDVTDRIPDAKAQAAKMLAAAKQKQDANAVSTWTKVQAGLRGDLNQFSVTNAAQQLKDAQSDSERTAWSIVHYALRVIDGQVNISRFD